MNPLRKTVIRLVVYGLVLGWIAGDLFLWNGILSRKIQRADPNTPEAIARAKAQGVVARVFNRQITRDQLERAVAERLWREGKGPSDLTKEALRMARYAALNDLIDHELLRVKAKAHAVDLKIEPAAIEERYQRFVSRFQSEEEMLDAARSQGIGNKGELRERITAWMQQEAYVELKIEPISQVADEEVRAWWEEHKEQLANPRRVQVRHIILPTLDRDAGEVKARMEEAYSALREGKNTFEELARTMSEDPQSKDKGGNLGWVTYGRLPSDFAGAVFEMKPGKPLLIQTTIGWHIAEVTGHELPEIRTFEEAEPEARVALESARRDKAVSTYRDALRQFEAHKIDVFHDMLE
jgi:peptidyl-prolyl cis-trans isomerase C